MCIAVPNITQQFDVLCQNKTANVHLITICKFLLHCVSFYFFWYISDRGGLILKTLEIENEALKILWYDNKN